MIKLIKVFLTKIKSKNCIKNNIVIYLNNISNIYI